MAQGDPLGNFEWPNNNNNEGRIPMPIVTDEKRMLSAEKNFINNLISEMNIDTYRVFYIIKVPLLCMKSKASILKWPRNCLKKYLAIYGTSCQND